MVMVSKFSYFPDELSKNDELREFELSGSNCINTAELSTSGTKHGYHMLTQGLYINEIIMRVDPQHRTLDQFFLEEIAEPLGNIISHILSF